MREPDYMTGRELRNTFAKICAGDDYESMSHTTRTWWDTFADTIKCPRLPKPPTMFEVYREWLNDGGCGTKSNDDVEDLRQRLNEAREAIDAHEAGRKK